MNIDILHIKEKLSMLMSEWNVPGICIGLTDLKGKTEIISLGKRNISKDENFNADTVIPIGCCSKAFTSMAISILEEKKFLSLDEPVKKYIDEFSFNSQFLTDNITIKDIICMRTGIHMNEVIYKRSSYSYIDVLNKIKFLTPYFGLREYFLYDAYLYNFLKIIITKITRMSWEEFILKELATPIGISNIEFDSDHNINDNYAIGSYYKHGCLVEDNRTWNISCIMPSAGIEISMNEILKWIEFILCDGKYNSKQIVSSTSMNKVFRPYILSKSRPIYRELFFQSYALGWFNEPYKGNNLFFHEGNVRSCSCLVGVLPDIKIGIAVFINKDECPLTRITLYNVIDSMLGLEQTDWSKRFKRESVIKKSWLTYCIKYDVAIERALIISSGQFFNNIYGMLEISNDNCGDLFLKMVDCKYIFFSMIEDWYVFNIDEDYLFLKHTELSKSIYVKFAINAKEIEFTKI